jgi:hypothetical protein
MRGRLLVLLPAAVAAILSARCFGFSYLFDDYDFLARALTFRPAHLLPDAASLFYRPLSRDLYFGVLALGGNRPFLGHLLNCGLVLIAVTLLVLLGKRLLGSRGGFISGIFFASLGCLPILVGWVSAIQDLLAIDFILAAILLQVEQRSFPAVLAMACAILSKETAVAVLPIVAGLDWILGGKPRHALRNVASYGLLLALWILVHPGLHILAQRGFQSANVGYLGLDNPNRALEAIRSLLTMFNLPVAGVSAAWITARLPELIVGLVVVGLGFRYARPNPQVSEPAPAFTKHRVRLLAACLAIGPMLLTVALVRVWAPYYACMSGIGSALLLASTLKAQPERRVLLTVLVFLTLGIVARGAKLDPTVTTEQNLERTSSALKRVERGFKSLYPSFPRGATVYVSVQTRGSESVYTHIHRFQALRVWYHDPTLVTDKPQRRRSVSRNEYLFWIEKNLDVAEINPITLRARSSGPKPQYFEYQKTLREYALGLASSGQARRAAAILLQMPHSNRAEWGFDARIAAAFLFREGSIEAARDVLAHVPPMAREDALDGLSGLLADLPPGFDIDDPALAAFGIESNDTGAMRLLMGWFRAKGYKSAALRFASKLNHLLPGDLEAQAVTRELTERMDYDRITPNVPADSL